MYRFGSMAVVMAVSMALSGCVAAQGSVPVIRKDRERAGLKMLKPGSRARACRTWVLGIPIGSPSRSLDEILAAMFADDREGDVLADVRVTTSGVMTGIVNRLCVDVSGDLGREISVVSLPAVGEGHEHHH